MKIKQRKKKMSELLRDRCGRILTGVPKGKTDRKKAYCVLRGFWMALKPKEQCAEHTQERTVQVKMIKPAPAVIIIPRE